jgi:hypothetical protein
MSVCILLSYLTRKSSHLSYTTMHCHLWAAAWLYHIFSHYLINGIIFGKNLLNKKMCFYFSTNLSETFLILRRIQQDINTNVHSNCYSCRIWMAFKFSWQRFKKYSAIKFNANPSRGSRAVACSRQADITLLTANSHSFLNALNNGRAKEIWQRRKTCDTGQKDLWHQSQRPVISVTQWTGWFHSSRHPRFSC